MTTSLTMTKRQWKGLREHLDSSTVAERFAVLLVGHARSRYGLSLLCHKVIPYQDQNLVDDSAGIFVSPQGIVHMMNAAKSARTGIVEVHSHPGTIAEAAFSQIDLQGHAEMVTYAMPELPKGCCYGSLVVGGPSVAGMLWESAGTPGVLIDRFVIADEPSPPEHSMTSAKGIEELGRYTRQVSLLGKAGQKRIANIRVGIVGLGGTGSIVARTLTYEGVRSFLLIDDDEVETSNLNRLDGATTWDAFWKRKKVRVLRREMRRIARKCCIDAIAKSLFTEKALKALTQVDVIFGCTDNDGTRLCLNELSAGYLKPYIDLGSGIVAENGRVENAGGRVTVAIPGDGCLLDAKSVDPKQGNYELADPSLQRFAREEGYVHGEKIKAPSVMSLNQTVASLAVTEFKALVTGIRPTIRLLHYDLLEGRLKPVLFQRNDSCVICNGYVGKGDLLGTIGKYAQ